MKRILIAEDDLHFKMALREVLYRAGYLVFGTQNGKRALENIGAYNPHLLLLDLKMPEVNGIEVLKRVNNEYPKLPVIIITAYTELRRDSNILQGNVFAFFSKPVDLEKVKMKVDEVLKDMS